MLYSQKTDNILVQVKPDFQDMQSDPSDNNYIWTYRVIITNEGDKAVRLKSRYWKIIDARGETEEISGEGVVGEQPYLEPGKKYEYTSGAPLRTPTGFMMGHYTMETGHGKRFDVEIPAFSLDSPYYMKMVN